MWAGKQQRQTVKMKVKKGSKIDTKVDNSTYIGTRPAKCTKQIWHS